MPYKIEAGSEFPRLSLPSVAHNVIELGIAKNAGNWQMLVVYRGKHCPLCARQLSALNELRAVADAAGVELVAVSGDGESKARAIVAEQHLNIPIAYDLPLDSMREWGLYISDPRTPQETDQPYAEPGVFVINEKGQVHIVSLSNAPFCRPDLAALLNGIAYIREHNYPIRGTKD